MAKPVSARSDAGRALARQHGLPTWTANMDRLVSSGRPLRHAATVSSRARKVPVRRRRHAALTDEMS